MDPSTSLTLTSAASLLQAVSALNQNADTTLRCLKPSSQFCFKFSIFFSLFFFSFELHKGSTRKREQNVGLTNALKLLEVLSTKIHYKNFPCK